LIRKQSEGRVNKYFYWI